MVWSTNTSGYGVDSSPAVAGGYVYVAQKLNGLVLCLNAASGAVEWTYNTKANIESSPAVAGGYVYIGDNNFNMTCLNAATGKLVWHYLTGGNVESSPAVSNGYVYFGSGDGYLYCLNANTGARVWSYDVTGVASPSPAIAGGYVYMSTETGTGATVYCLPMILGTSGGSPGGGGSTGAPAPGFPIGLSILVVAGTLAGLAIVSRKRFTI
jgi:outer membrane protein assembly factor BamB